MLVMWRLPHNVVIGNDTLEDAYHVPVMTENGIGAVNYNELICAIFTQWCKDV